MTTHPRRRTWALPLSFTVVLVLAVSAHAQVVATTFEELRFKVKAGDTVYVTDDSGKSEREARILDLTASSLAVSIGGVRLDLMESDVTRIRQRLPDSKKNDALIGFLVGAAGSTTIAAPADLRRKSCCVPSCGPRRRASVSRFGSSPDYS